MIKVLVVDDSAVVRKVLTEELSKHPDIEVVGSAADPYIARDKILKLDPHVLTLDIEMPRMDGLSFLAKLMQHHPLPVVIVSSLAPANSETALRALELGAIEIVPKPGSQYSVPDVNRLLLKAVRAAAVARPRCILDLPPAPTSHVAKPLPQLQTTDRILAIGASTGGTIAIERVLRKLPAATPGTVIVQHMPEGFTAPFADRLDGLAAMAVREAKDGDPVVRGLALIAPGNKHMLLKRSGAHYHVIIKDGPPVHYQRPSVDVLFQSVAVAAGRNSMGVILTGMGADGAKGLKEMRDAGSHTIAQDEESCVVYGMPKEAAKIGAAVEILPLDLVPQAVTKWAE